MACVLINTVDGRVIACSRNARSTLNQTCSVTGCVTLHSRLCDALVGQGTCDAKLCEAHAFRVGEDRDRCPEHTCTLCRWIAEDLRANGRLTEGYPPQGPMMMEPLFPVSGKIAHIFLEKFAIVLLDGKSRARIISVLAE